MVVLNYILIAVLLISLVAGMVWYVRKLNTTSEDVVYDNPYTEKHLVQGVAEVFSLQLKQNLKDMNLSRYELNIENKKKAQLRSSLKEAAYGNRAAKKYIKDFIKDIIRSNDKLGIDEDTINNVIKFDSINSLKDKDKFEIAVHIFNKKYGDKGLSELIDQYELDKPKTDEDGNTYYEITASDIDAAYRDIIQSYKLTYDDKLDILSQRIFEQYKGFGAVDLLFDGTIDEIDCGVSGIPKDAYDIKSGEVNVKNLLFSYDAVWIVYHGRNIRLSAIGLGSQSELIRVCQNIYKFNAPQALSRRNGGIVSTMKDGSRIVVVRPPLSDSWGFFSRKFDSTPSIAPQDLFKDENSDMVITMIKWLIKGHRNMIVTGSQGTGKTTTLKSVLRFVPKFLTIRIQEKAFEMNLRYVYPDRNIVTFQETDTISMQEGINLQKKTNGSINVFGEIASREGSDEYLQTCRVASLFGIGTHHAKTTKDLIRSFAVDGETEETVSQTINVDIHMENAAGHRFCQRITEVIPIRDRRYPSEIENDTDMTANLYKDTMEFEKRMTDREIFKAVDLIEFKDGKYHMVNMPSDDMVISIKNNLTDDEQAEFENDMEALRMRMTA